MGSTRQTLPVRMYQTGERVMIATPMPGLEPGDISVRVEGERVTIDGEERGPHQHEKDLLVAEWAVGPYHREIDLPHPVNGPLTNATYGNGVLVLSMPKASSGERGASADIRLQPIDATRGERVGHTGRDVQPQPESQRRERETAERAR